MRVACIDPTSKVVLNILEVESLDKVPDIVGVREDGTPIRKEEVIIVETTTGSVGDIYIEGVGFFRFAGE
jgi:hypothetical protein